MCVSVNRNQNECEEQIGPNGPIYNNYDHRVNHSIDTSHFSIQQFNGTWAICVRRTNLNKTFDNKR